MNDNNTLDQFGDFLVSSWTDTNGFWRRINEVAEDCTAALKGAVVPVVAGLMVGAFVYSAPTTTWASEPTQLQQSISDQSMASVLSNFESLSPKDKASRQDDSKIAEALIADTATLAKTEILRIKSNIFQLLDQMESGDLPEISSEVSRLAKKAAFASRTSDSGFFLGDYLLQVKSV
jgi:hypothetical protein